jgi:hypothetical protein
MHVFAEFLGERTKRLSGMELEKIMIRKHYLKALATLLIAAGVQWVTLTRLRDRAGATTA